MGKAERRKHVGYNKKQVRNINEIIEKDHKTVKDGKKRVSTEEELKKRKFKRREERPQDDAIHAPTNVVAADHVSAKEDDQKADRDIEMEQQQMMNRVFNCPNLYSASGPFTTMVQMVPVVVPNQSGGFFVVQLPVQPLLQPRTMALLTGQTRVRMRQRAWRRWSRTSWTSATTCPWRRRATMKLTLRSLTRTLKE